MLWFYSLRELGRRRARTLLTLAGIVIGVAAVVSVSTVTTATKQAYRDMFASVAGDAELEVVGVGSDGFDPALAERIEGVAGVEAALPAVQAPGALVTRRARTVSLVLGVDPLRDAAAREYRVTAGETFLGATWAGEGTPVLLEQGFAASQGLGPGDTASLITEAGTTEVTVLGLVDPQGAAIFNGGAVLFTPLERAQALFGLEGRVNLLQLVLDSAEPVASVEAAVREVLPEGLTVRSPGARGRLAEDALLSSEQGLNTLAALSLVTAVFIVVNAFLMSFTERRRELALMRALGTTRRQLTRLVLREALVLGVAGTLVGVGLGLGGSMLLTLAMEAQLGVELPALTVTPGPLLAGALLGVVASTLSAYLPARRAGRVSPLEGLTEEAAPISAMRRRTPAVIGLGLLAIVAVLVLGVLAGTVPSGATAPAMAGLLLGLVLLLPAVLPYLRAAVEALLGPLVGGGGRIAFRQLDRHPTRTVLTVGVLFVAITVAISMGGAMLNNVDDVQEWYERTVDADFFVRAALPETGTNMTAAMPGSLGEEIARVDGVTGVERLSFRPATVGGEQAVVLARSFDGEGPLSLDLQSGSPDQVLEGLRDGGVVLGGLLAARLEAEVGDTVSLLTVEGARDLPVVGTATEYTAGGASFYLEYDRASELLGVEGVDVFMVQVADGSEAAVGGDLAELAEPRSLLVQSLADFRRFIDDLVSGTMAFLWMLLLLIFAVAAIGVVNTLTMNVLEQTREIGLLRAVAMTKRQVRRFVLAQALALGAMSALPGLVAGVAVAWLLNTATAGVIGQEVQFSLRPVLTVAAPLATVVLAVAAAYLPARRAARLSVVEALQVE